MTNNEQNTQASQTVYLFKNDSVYDVFESKEQAEYFKNNFMRNDMNSYEYFRNTWEFIDEKNLSDHGIKLVKKHFKEEERKKAFLAICESN